MPNHQFAFPFHEKVESHDTMVNPVIDRAALDRQFLHFPLRIKKLEADQNYQKLGRIKR
jgi:hypothetical protein